MDLMTRLVSRAPAFALLAVARAVARTRPLGRQPGWSFGWRDPSPMPFSGLRELLWRECHRRRLQRPVIVRWYEGLRVHLHLGNDTSWCLYVGGCIDPNEFVYLNEVIASGMVFVDVGANEGLYSLFASRRVGAEGLVLALEPSAREFDRLQRNLALNRTSNVRARRLAAGERAGVARLRIAGYEHEGHNTFGDFAYAVDTERFEDVEVRTLDEILAEEEIRRVDVLKIDVEGGEAAVLRGAHGTLERQRPIVMLELFDDALRKQGSAAAEVIHLLGGLGYRLFTYHEGSGDLVALDGVQAQSLNVVAIPTRG
jgi:FkbM family methyltransferase